MSDFVIIIIGCLLIPVLTLIIGAVMKNDPPERINYAYGYRTRRSMKNQDTWEFAHELCGKIWVVVGSVMLVISLAAMIISMVAGRLENAAVWIVSINVVVMILSSIPVEVALARTFDKDGNRK